MTRRRKQKLIKNVFSLFVLVIILLAVFQIIKLDILPEKYLILFLIGEAALFLLAFILYNIRKKVLIIIGLILYIVILIGNIFGYYYLSKINNYLDNNLNQDTYKIKTSYYLITHKNSKAEKLDDLNNKSKIDYYKYSRAIKLAKKKLGKYQYTEKNTIIDSLKEMQTEDKYFLVASANYDYLFENSKLNTINKDDYKIIYKFNVYEELKTNKETPDSYNIYLTGLDFTGVMRDYNMIATVNTKTHKVVLTSIPRGTYIDVPGYNIKDNLMCMGALDSEVSKEALEKFLDIKIDYTINLNTNSLVDIVDSLNCIEFCSDMAFKTTHALVLDTYDDKGKKLYVPKGCATYNGIEILTIARERNAFPGRDVYRQKNCRKILISIVKKLASTTTITNYTEVINSLDGLYTTDMNEKTIKNLVKSGLSGSNYEIIEQSIDGTDSKGMVHLGTV